LNGLRIGEKFALPLEFVTSTQAILARKRSGKSYIDVTFDGRHDEDRCTRVVCRKCLIKWRDMIYELMTPPEVL
jgi:hypothetical protein